MVNDLAPDHLRGRYNAMSSLVFQLAAVVAPAIAGFLVGTAWPWGTSSLLLLGCLAVAGLALLAERRSRPRSTVCVGRRPPPVPRADDVLAHGVLGGVGVADETASRTARWATLDSLISSALGSPT